MIHGNFSYNRGLRISFVVSRATALRQDESEDIRTLAASCLKMAHDAAPHDCIEAFRSVLWTTCCVSTMPLEVTTGNISKA